MIIIPSILNWFNHTRPVHHRRRVTDHKVKAPYTMPDDLKEQLQKDQPDWLRQALVKQPIEKGNRKYRFMTWMSKRFPWAFHNQEVTNDSQKKD